MHGLADALVGAAPADDALLTLAFTQLFFTICYRWTDVTGGENGISGLKRPDSFLGLDLRSDHAFYYVCLVLLLACILLIQRILDAPFGRVLQAIRDNEVRAASVGYNPRRYRHVAVIISGTFVGLAGALFAAEILYSSPEFEAEVILPTGLASVVAYCTFGLFFGWRPLFETPQLEFDNPWQLVPYLVLAIWMAVLAMLYTRTFYAFTRLFARWRIAPALKPAIGAAATGVIGLLLYYLFGRSQSVLSVMSFGYGILQQGFTDSVNVTALLLLAVAFGKILTTSLTIGSGGSGPKRMRGDKVTPVGTYRIVGKIPGLFHQFLTVSYPNAEDRRRFAEAKARNEIQARIARLAPFYAQAATGPRINKFGEPAVIAYNHEENFSRTEDLVGSLLSRELFGHIRTFARNFLKDHRALFLQRIRQGRIRDCHGDLHMKNICLADEVYIFDCIEFNPRFRYGDVAADIDFLAMDLDFHGFKDLSRYLVERLAQAVADPELLVMLDFYKCYRAYVRGKIAAFTARDPELAPEARAQAEQTARAYFLLAGEYAEAGARWAA